MRLKLIFLCAFTICAALTCGTAHADGVIPVVNASFESLGTLVGCGVGCAYSSGPIPGWTITGIGGSYQPSSSQLTLPSQDGSFVAYSNGGTISQDLGVSVQANSTYTLSVDIGHRAGLVSTYSIALDDGSATLCTTNPANSNGGIPVGTFATVTLTCTTGFAVAPGDLTIVLTAGGQQIDFDYVSLVDPVATPEPAAVLLMVVGLGFVALFWGYSGRKDALQRGAC
jgi:hypothetical protein